MKILLGCLIFFIFIQFSSCEENKKPKQPLEYYLREGDSKLRDGKYTEASNFYSIALGKLNIKIKILYLIRNGTKKYKSFI